GRDRVLPADADERRGQPELPGTHRDVRGATKGLGPRGHRRRAAPGERVDRDDQVAAHESRDDDVDHLAPSTGPRPGCALRIRPASGPAADNLPACCTPAWSRRSRGTPSLRPPPCSTSPPSARTPPTS